MLEHIPSGLLDQATPLIKSIISKKAQKFTFSYFQDADIGQEIWIICLKALPKFEHGKGHLSNFLTKCVNNRLKNLKRDKYFKSPKKDPSKIQSRLNIINAISLYDDKSSINNDPSDNLMAKELADQIKKHLSNDMRKDLELLLNGDLLDEERIGKLKKKIKSILAKCRDDE